ncbi:MAG: DUF6644 family protein [Steroidobacteraceae bacterium]
MSIFDWLGQALLNTCGVEQYPPEPGTVISFLQWMEGSAVGTCVMQSPAGFYILLGFHAVGLAMVVGVMAVVSMRILGVAKGISAAALPKLVKLSWAGFWINACSGVFLFIGEADKMFHNNTFRWKIFLVAVGMISTYIMNRTILIPAAAGNTSLINGSSAKFQAIFSILVWLAVITTGRMIAYLTGGGS